MRRLEERFVAWAKTRPDVRAALVIGSRARADHPADAFSDLDVVVAAKQPERYLDSADWVGRIGVPLLTFAEATATGGGRERRVVFEGGYDVDFAFFPVWLLRALLFTTRSSRRWPRSILLLPRRLRRQHARRVEEFRAVVTRGHLVILDKDELLGRLLRELDVVPEETALPPKQKEVEEVVDDFFYHALWAAKKLRRGELMVAKMCCDATLKGLLVRMTAWHARTIHGWSYDTWRRGRFFEEWADPRIVAGLRRAYARYDAHEIKQALRATTGLFRWSPAKPRSAYAIRTHSTQTNASQASWKRCSPTAITKLSVLDLGCRSATITCPQY